MRLPGKGMGWKEFFKALKTEWARDKASDVAGSVTFFGVLALFPFIIFLISLASVIIDPRDAQALIQQLTQVAPPQVTDILGQRIQQLAEGNNTGLLTVGALGAIWAASGGVVALMSALNTTYDVEESRPFWKVRGIAILMTLGGAALGIIAAMVAVVTPAIADKLGEPIGTIVTWLRLPVAALFMMLLWALIYYVLPDVEQRFRFISPGSVVGVLVWVLTSWGFSKYVQNFGSYDATYGAVGGIIVLLLWMYITSQVLLLGAEINSVIEHKSPEGKAPGKKRLDEPGPAATKSELDGGEQAQRARRQQAGLALTRKADAPPMNPPAKAAAVWAAGFGLGVWLLRRSREAHG